MTKLKYPLFDGEKIWEAACVTLENGLITDVSEAAIDAVDTNCLLMPGLIDSHTHMSAETQISAMLRSGITTTCDVSAPVKMIKNSKYLRIVDSGGMAMFISNGKNYVTHAVSKGAEYIKVLLFDHNTISKHALRAMCTAAHERRLKVVAHATSVYTYRLAVDCNVDIILHVPMKEKFPVDLAGTIAEKGIAVAPTLVMMEAFSLSGKGGYKQSDYAMAEDAVKTLRQHGATLLAATDSNIGGFAPAVEHGASLYREMELLSRLGIDNLEILAAATWKNAAAFGLPNAGLIAPGMPATMLLVEGRPDRNIVESRKVKKLWVCGEDANI